MSEQSDGSWEYLTVGPFRLPHERDTACNRLCEQDGRWHMHSSDVHRKTGDYFAIMCRWLPSYERADS